MLKQIEIVLFFFICCSLGSTINIWPYPKEIDFGKTILCVDQQNIHINTTYKSDILVNYANQVFEEVFIHRLNPSKVQCIHEIQISISTIQTTVNLEMDESYDLKITNNTSPIFIESKTIFGTFHALQTLSQLIVYSMDDSQYQIHNNPITIHDAPRFSHRGLLIDTSRHYLPINVLKEILDSMKYVKLNVFHWHITDDQSVPIQSKVNNLWWNGAYSQYERYTLNDVRNIVQYAQERGIRVIPELNIPGHSISWCKGYPALCPSQSCQTPLNPVSNITIPFIKSIINEWIQNNSKSNETTAIFQDEYFHLGGNDVNTDCWNKVDEVIEWLKKNSMSDKDTYAYFLKAGKTELQKNKKISIFYDDVYTNFKNTLVNNTVIQVLSNLQTIPNIIADGYPVIISDIDHWQVNKIMNTWSVAYEHELYSTVPKEEQRQFILGGEALLFGEFIDPSDLFSTLYPSGAAIAEKLWSFNTTWKSKDVNSRLHAFRFFLHSRGIGASPLSCTNNRDIPEGPGSLFEQ